MSRAQKVLLTVTVAVLLVAALHPIRTFNRVTGVTENDYRAVLAFFAFTLLMAVTLYFLLAGDRKPVNTGGQLPNGIEKEQK